MDAKNFKKMNDFELDNVVGGTVDELNGLVSACAKNPTLTHMTDFGFHMTMANSAVAKLMERALDQIGIKADISVGYAGTGIGSKHNTYIDKSTGNSLSQAEVEKRLETYAI